MNLITLTETIIKKIVSDPESVSVKEFKTDKKRKAQYDNCCFGLYGTAGNNRRACEEKLLLR